MPLVVTAIVIGGLFSYSIYCIFTINSIPTHNELSIQTVPNNNEVGIQTESLVNIQPNIDTISELPETLYPVLKPNVLPDNLHVDASTQTQTIYEVFKEWLRIEHGIDLSDVVPTTTPTPTVERVGLESTSNGLPDLVELGNSVIPSGWTFKGYDFGIHNMELLSKIMSTSDIIETVKINNITYSVVYINDQMLTIDPNILINNPLFW
jgi:hypothetical protein